MALTQVQAKISKNPELCTSRSHKIKNYLSGIEMGRSLVFSTNIPLEFSQNPRLFPLLNHSKLCFPQRFIENSRCGYKKTKLLNLKLAGNVCTKAALSEITNERKYPKVGAPSTGPISANHLIQVVETAAKTGAEVCFFFLLALSFKDSLTE